MKSPIQDRRGQAHAPRGISRGVTGPKAAEDVVLHGVELRSLIFEALPEHIALVDPDGVILAVNEAWSRFAAENGGANVLSLAVGANYLDICRRAVAAGEPEVDQALAGIESVLAGTSTRFTLDYPCHGPRVQRWFSMTVVPFGFQGKRGAVISHRHVIERKQAAEEELRKAHIRMETALDVAEMGSYQYMGSLRSGIFDARARRILGLKAGDQPHLVWAERIVWSERIHRENGVQLFEMMREVETGDRDQATHEYRYLHPERGVIWLLHSVRVLSRDASGVVTSLVGVVQDITACKEAETALRESEERLRLAQSAARLGIWDWDFTSDRIRCTPELEQIFGYEPGTIPGTCTDLLERVHPSDLAEVKRHRDEAIQAHRSFSLDFRVMLPSGETRWVNFTGAAMYDEAGYPLRVLGAAVDNTQRKQVETLLATSLRDLRNAQSELMCKERLATLGKLAGCVAHEMRSPLAVIQNNIFFLKHSLPSSGETVREVLAEIERAVDSSNHIINELLDYAREPMVSEDTFPIGDAISRALQLVPMPNTIRLQGRTSEERKLDVRANQDQVIRILVNLIQNAIQAMPDGGELQVSAREDAGKVCVKVRDTGCGIPKDNLDKIFTPLFSTKSTGIGLGLPIVERYVKLNGGELSVESEVGHGTTFAVILKPPSCD